MTSLSQSQGVAPHLLSHLGSKVEFTEPTSQTQNYKPRDILATFNYFKDNEDGSPPEPNIVSKPQTYQRPATSQQLTVHDIRGSEDQYTLDSTGFQIVKHKSVEKDFLDEERIKSIYYPEAEALLKEA
jgi:hypothetical protein